MHKIDIIYNIFTIYVNIYNISIHIHILTAINCKYCIIYYIYIYIYIYYYIYIV